MASLMIGKRQRWQKLCSSRDGLRGKRLKNEDTTHLLQNLHPNPTPDLSISTANLKTIPACKDCPPTPTPTTDHVPPPSNPRLVRRPEAWDTDMIAYLAASRLCREEAMACSLLSEQIPLDPNLTNTKGHKAKSKKNKMMEKRKSSVSPSASRSPSSSAPSLSSSSSSSSSSKALTVSRSWGGNLKKILCKQFMPFSTSNSASRILQARSNMLDIKKMDGHALPLIMEEKEGPTKKNRLDRKKSKPRKPYGDENRVMP